MTPTATREDALRRDHATARSARPTGGRRPVRCQAQRGGMVDAEFAVQFLVLAHAGAARPRWTTWATSHVAAAGAPACCPGLVAPPQPTPTEPCASAQHRARLNEEPTRWTTTPLQVERAAIGRCWRAAYAHLSAATPASARIGGIGGPFHALESAGAALKSRKLERTCPWRALAFDAMNLVQVTIDSIAIGQPLRFCLRDESGTLLARRAFVIGLRADLKTGPRPRQRLFVDVPRANGIRRPSSASCSSWCATTAPPQDRHGQPHHPRPESRADTNAMCRTGQTCRFRATGCCATWSRTIFPDELDRLQATAGSTGPRQSGRCAVRAFRARQQRGGDVQRHARHAGRCDACWPREVLRWPEADEAFLRKAALTMNLGMTALQDRLASQREPPTGEQRAMIEHHPQRSVGRCCASWAWTTRLAGGGARSPCHQTWRQRCNHATGRERMAR